MREGIDGAEEEVDADEAEVDVDEEDSVEDLGAVPDEVVRDLGAV